eukprot:gnl/MRDRNA2_/MRDRNA2_137989_c0_seq1.p1 gnl/MRDRNA2_/MRDRNA2_137989_c0~~gnl/MRDRNA2_/MRDRNA2_137989_c0_seq1.p1  ORF type:complete len:355 (+),score=72.49 gnl/MRDRNA2_/MRDRNA2_137989_c0_seq1:54-1067(+)
MKLSELIIEDRTQGDKDNEALALAGNAGQTALDYATGAAALGPASGALYAALRHWLPKDDISDKARLVGLASGCVADKAVWPVQMAMAAAAATAIASHAAIAAPLALGVVAVDEGTPIVAMLAGTAVGYASLAMRTEEDAKKDADTYYYLWRYSWPAVVTAAHTFHNVLYNNVLLDLNCFPESAMIIPRGASVLGWNNMGVGDDGDVLEMVSYRWPSLRRSQVIIEFTALPHITWAKRLVVKVQPKSSEGSEQLDEEEENDEEENSENLDISKDKRRATSRVFDLKTEWPLELQVQKGITVWGCYKDVGKPWAFWNKEELRGRLVRLVYCQVKPKDC